MGYLNTFIEYVEKYNNCDRAAYMLFDETHNDMHKIVYKYISLNKNLDLNESKFKCLLEEKIYLSTADEFNDPYDDRAIFFDADELVKFTPQYRLKWSLDDPYANFKRFACFTKSGVENMPMWAHYANNSSGYCVEYILNKNNFDLTAATFPVDYTKFRFDITQSLKKQIEKSNGKTEQIEDFLLWSSIFGSYVKEETWSYENEYRCVYPSDTLTTPYIDAYPSKIFIGTQCDINHKERLIDIAKKIKVPIYQMKIHTTSYGLISEKID